jgi:hypothetical protein
MQDMAKSKRASRKAGDDLFSELTTWIAEQDRIAAEASKSWDAALAPPSFDFPPSALPPIIDKLSSTHFSDTTR